MFWGSRHSRCGASWTGNWVVGEHKQETWAACRCVIDEGVVQLLRWYAAIETKGAWFIPCAPVLACPYAWHPLFPIPSHSLWSFCFFFILWKTSTVLSNALPALSLGRSCTWTSSSRHCNYAESYSLGQKIDRNIKLPMLCQNKIKKIEKRILTKCFEWRDLNLPPVFPGLADIIGSACWYKWFREHLLAAFLLKKQHLSFASVVILLYLKKSCVLCMFRLKSDSQG